MCAMLANLRLTILPPSLPSWLVEPGLDVELQGRQQRLGLLFENADQRCIVCKICSLVASPATSF